MMPRRWRYTRYRRTARRLRRTILPPAIDNFALQRAADFGTVNHVRTFVAFITLLTGASSLFAQEQENKLIDRLLKPDMSLANPIQNKQFSTQSASVSKSVATQTFQTSEASSAKSFGQVPALSPGEFGVRHFRTGDAKANLTTRSRPPDAGTVQIASAASGTRLATENGKTVKVAAFPDDRPFLGQGKSQKALHGYDRPLTIEQVRELLNKNK